MAHAHSGSIQRIRYYDDQRLTAQDLQAAAESETRLRELHVRALHNTWGVALGFEVRLSQQYAAVQVGPGLAYDCQGREIVSARPLLIKLPNPPATPLADDRRWVFDLLIRYADVQTLKGDRPLTGTCLGNHPTEERPLWRWSYAGEAELGAPHPLADEVRLGEEIPLVRLLLGRSPVGQPPLRELDLSQRRSTQGLTRPHLANGLVRQDSITVTGSPLAWSARIDTTSGGFSSSGAPSGVFYFANLVSHPFSQTSSFARSLPSDALTRLLRELFGPFVSMTYPYTREFTLNVRFAARNRATFLRLLNDYPDLTRSQALSLPIAVHWLGVELVKGCPPPPIQNFFAFPAFWWNPSFFNLIALA